MRRYNFVSVSVRSNPSKAQDTSWQGVFDARLESDKELEGKKGKKQEKETGAAAKKARKKSRWPKAEALVSAASTCLGVSQLSPSFDLRSQAAHEKPCEACKTF